MYLSPQSFAPYSITAHTFAQPGHVFAGLRGATIQPRSAWRGLGRRGYFNSFLFGGAFAPDFGYWERRANYQMLPMGFGLWPACDSAAIPGRFWTIGPCAGIGDYQSVAPSYENEYPMGATPPPYYSILQIIEQPETVPPAAKKQTAPEKQPNMLVCLTNGQKTEVSDWWVTGGRFYFVPLNEKSQSVDLDSLDLRKTIEQNEKRGRTFMLNFTPPSERPVLPELP